MGNVVCFNFNPIKEKFFAYYMWINFGTSLYVEMLAHENTEKQTCNISSYIHSKDLIQYQKTCSVFKNVSGLMLLMD